MSITKKQKLAAVIPAFNEAHSIEQIVSQISTRALAIVVDDGSTDDTASIARAAGAYVVVHPINRGYDAALQSGLSSASALGCSFVVTIDADGQHDPAFLDLFLNEFECGADLVLGSRERLQRWSEVLFGFIGWILWSVRDPLCGMKGYRVDVYKQMKHINTYNSIGTELAIRLIKGGIKPRELTIKTSPRAGVSRFGEGFKANLKIIKALCLGLIIPIKDAVDDGNKIKN